MAPSGHRWSQGFSRLVFRSMGGTIRPLMGGTIQPLILFKNRLIQEK
ncbi:hypothetical protein RSSM_01185 [Rhodopirellula sallentina SM41]|uniref:Uncharacterized protein n=1 Tax=Rhodopirellula sallentina SM41 TaxID=1263870 RepID=M5U7U7_9BACT|nr:hypothetical protein RSSM_01185 [Rhodopirellula sallentina SM41]